MENPYGYDDGEGLNSMLAGVVSPASAAQLVGPPPDSPPQTAPGQTTPQTGTLARPPQHSIAKNLDTPQGRAQYSGVSRPANGGYVTSTAVPAQEGVKPAIQQAQPMQPASVQPGQAIQPAQVNPDPGGFARPGGTSPAMPVLPQTGPQQVKGPSQLDLDQSKLANLTNSGSGVSQIQNPFLRGLARVGDIAGSILAPGVAAAIPGTTLHHQQLLGQQQQIVGNELSQQQVAAQTADVQSQSAERTAKAASEQPFTVSAADAAAVGLPDLEGASMRRSDYGKLPLQGLKNQGTAAVADTRAEAMDDSTAMRSGMKPTTDDKGNKTYVADEDSPIYQSKQAQAKAAQATAELKQAGNDPSSPAYQLALKKAQTASSNANAANIRANAYALNANVGNLGVDNQGKAVNGINTLHGAPMGTRVAPQAAKAMGNIAKFQDVYSSIDNANAAIDDGAKSGAKFNTAKMAEALSDPKTTSAQWLAGKVNTTLTPQEQNIVITTKALHEQIMAMRGAIGSGGVSDTQANRLIAQLPSATTPDMNYARRQLATVRGQLDRLQAGLPGVNNGPTVQQPLAPAKPTSPGGVPKGIPSAQPPQGQIPPAAAKQLQEGKLHTFNNGQQWTLKNGQPVRVQ